MSRPVSPVHRELKFSTTLGTVLVRNAISVQYPLSRFASDRDRQVDRIDNQRDTICAFVLFFCATLYRMNANGQGFALAQKIIDVQ